MLPIAYESNVNYLSNYDYIDLVNLGVADDDTLLKSILQNRLPGVKISKDKNISDVLFMLYDQITELIEKLYPIDIIPRWVDSVKFKDDMKRKIYTEISYILENDFLEAIIMGDVINYFNEKNNELYINKVILTFPFVAYNRKYYIDEENVSDIEKIKYLDDIHDTIKISDELILIISSILGTYEDLDNVFNRETINEILFIRDHTWQLSNPQVL